MNEDIIIYRRPGAFSDSEHKLQIALYTLHNAINGLWIKTYHPKVKIWHLETGFNHR